ncbi:PfkB family carbohydrate kinase, partial [Candidatus Kryptobacter tengchongensis]|uniref:PfkB family carbohydrate kinase n=1 Tax=Kryptobacter tengchongensis TaxID=1643429 RepID=UPI0007077DDD
LDLGVKVMVITKANLGATVYYFANGLKRVDLKAFEVDVVDPTGCGDVFGSAFFYRYSKTLEPVISAEFANYVAGLNATNSAIFIAISPTISSGTPSIAFDFKRISGTSLT